MVDRKISKKELRAEIIGLSAVLFATIKHLLPADDRERDRVLDAIKAEALRELDSRVADKEDLAAAADIIMRAAPRR